MEHVADSQFLESGLLNEASQTRYVKLQQLSQARVPAKIQRIRVKVKVVRPGMDHWSRCRQENLTARFDGVLWLQLPAFVKLKNTCDAPRQNLTPIGKRPITHQLFQEL